jgi:hypothetical protein
VVVVVAVALASAAVEECSCIWMRACGVDAASSLSESSSQAISSSAVSAEAPESLAVSQLGL